MLKTNEITSHELQGKTFPCPVCQTALSILLSVKRKPYCTCNECGIQIFFRGKLGIHRLETILRESDTPAKQIPRTSSAAALYTRLEQLREEKSQLEAKQGIFFRDDSLDDALAALESEILRLERALKKSRKTAEGGK
jgi:hypothetical protein